MLTTAVVALAILAPFQDSAPAGSPSSSSSMSAGAKRDAAQGKVPYRKLKWEDFTVKEDPPTRHMAWTEAFINYDYKWRATWTGRHYEAKVKQWEVRSGLDCRGTWRRNSLVMTDRLLLHEQGHLDINEIEARKLRKLSLSDLPFGIGSSPSAAGADLDTRVRRFIDERLKDVRSRQSLYDEETFHSLRREPQEKWEATIKKELAGG